MSWLCKVCMHCYGSTVKPGRRARMDRDTLNTHRPTFFQVFGTETQSNSSSTLVIARNGYFCHSKNILLEMLADERDRIEDL